MQDINNVFLNPLWSKSAVDAGITISDDTSSIPTILIDNTTIMAVSITSSVSIFSTGRPDAFADVSSNVM